METTVAPLTFVEIGDQSQGEHGFYETTVNQANIGLTFVNCYSYQVTFATRDNSREGEINPKAIAILEKNVAVNQYLKKELVKYFLPFLQEKLDNLN